MCVRAQSQIVRTLSERERERELCINASSLPVSLDVHRCGSLIYPSFFALASQHRRLNGDQPAGLPSSCTLTLFARLCLLSYGLIYPHSYFIHLTWFFLLLLIPLHTQRTSNLLFLANTCTQFRVTRSYNVLHCPWPSTHPIHMNWEFNFDSDVSFLFLFLFTTYPQSHTHTHTHSDIRA